MDLNLSKLIKVEKTLPFHLTFLGKKKLQKKYNYEFLLINK